MKTRGLGTLGIAFLLLARGAAAAPGVWTPVGPSGGGPSVLAPDPTDARVIYGAFNPGPNRDLETFVRRSSDGGASWTPANDGLEGERIIALAVDADLPARLFAVAAPQGCLSDDPGGIYRSEDRGAHWRRLLPAGEAAPVECRSSILAGGGVVLVGTSAGVVRSLDGGDTWQRIDFTDNPYNVHTLVRDPSQPERIDAGGWSARMRSDDGGATWQRIIDPFPVEDIPWVTGFALAPSRPDTIYETTSGADLARSDDGGATWHTLPSGRTDVGIWDSTFLVDPRDPDTLFSTGAGGLLRSRDGGETFHVVRRDLPPLDGTDARHVLALAADAAGGVLLGIDSGLWRTADSGFHWQAAAMRGLRDNPIGFLQTDVAAPGQLLFTSFADVYVGRGSGATFERRAQPGVGTIIDLELDPTRSGHAYAVTQHYDDANRRRLLETVDGARTWTAVPAPAYPYAAGAAGPDTLLLASGNTIQRRVGGSWRRVLRVEPTDEDRGGFWFSRIAVDPQRPSTVIAVGNDFFLHVGSYPVLYASLDAGATWTRLSTSSYVFAFDPHDPNVALVALGNAVDRVRLDRPSRRRAGAIPGAFRIGALLVDRDDARTLYAVTGNVGARVSHDGGATWGPLGAELPRVDPYAPVALAQDTADARRLYFAPFASGLWSLDLPER